MLMAMDVLSLARFQFAMTTVFHFFSYRFQLVWVLWLPSWKRCMYTKRMRTYKKMAKFWGKIFLLSFCCPGSLPVLFRISIWHELVKLFTIHGGYFRVPLAVEALLAFFMESTFIGLWMFTWDRFKPAVHAIFIWMTGLGTTLSAIWILSANAFMQHPTGFAISQTTGRVKLVDFGAVITNPQLWVEFPHVIFGAFTTAGFAVAGMAAWRLLKKDHVDFTRSPIRSAWLSGPLHLLVRLALVTCRRNSSLRINR